MQHTDLASRAPENRFSTVITIAELILRWPQCLHMFRLTQRLLWARVWWQKKIHGDVLRLKAAAHLRNRIMLQPVPAPGTTCRCHSRRSTLPLSRIPAPLLCNCLWLHNGRPLLRKRIWSSVHLPSPATGHILKNTSCKLHGRQQPLLQTRNSFRNRSWDAPAHKHLQAAIPSTSLSCRHCNHLTRKVSIPAQDHWKLPESPNLKGRPPDCDRKP